MSSDSKTYMNRLEWCTELPVLNQPRESPVIMLNDNELYFKFAVDKVGGLWRYVVYMEFKKRQADLKLCYVSFQIGFKNAETLDLFKGKFSTSLEHYRVWSIDFTSVCLPWDYPIGNSIKFAFEFQNAHVPISILKFNKVTVDKCIQTASYLNADTSLESLHNDFSKLLETGLDHDLEMKCGKHSLMVHKLVLCARSDVLKAMLKNDMLEGQTGVVKLQDLDGIYFQDFIRYLYTGIMPELTIDKSKALYEVGDKYAVRSLMLRCSEYLQDNLSSEHSFECFALADAHSDQKLKDRIITFMLEKKMYLQRKYWAPFCDSFPKAAIEVYRLSYEENQGE